MDAKRKTLLAASLVLIWAGLAVWQWGGLEEPVRVPLTNVTGPAASGRHMDGKEGGLHVNLELLATTGIRRETAFVTPRNVFTGPSSEGIPSSSNTDATGEHREGLVSAEAVTEIEQAEVIESGPLRYLGFLRMGEGRENKKDMAVLSKGDEVLVLKVGDRIDDHLVLKAISSESVTLRNPGTRADQVVLLSEEPARQE